LADIWKEFSERPNDVSEKPREINAIEESSDSAESISEASSSSSEDFGRRKGKKIDTGRFNSIDLDHINAEATKGQNEKQPEIRPTDDSFGNWNELGEEVEI
jgi:hypothetical protein